jgi:hypothetical protein
MALVLRRGWATSALGCVLAVFCRGTSAHAEAPLPAPITGWAVPDECPNAESMLQRLMSLGGGDARGLADAGTVRGVIVKDADEWVLVLQIVQADDGSRGMDATTTPGRVLRAKDCDELANAAAVAIAIALGGAPKPPEPALPAHPALRSSGEATTAKPTYSASATRAPSASATRATSASATRAPPASALARAPVVAAPSPLPQSPPAPAVSSSQAEVADAGAARQDATSAFGVVPSVEFVFDPTSLGRAAFGPGAQLQLRWGALGLGAYGLWLPERQIPVAQTQYVELSLLSAGLRGCFRVSDTMPTIDACGGGEFGALEAAGRGLRDARRRRDPWGAATAGVLLGVDVGALLRAGVRLEAVVPFSRERYVVNRDQVIHEVPAASARLALTLAGSFGPH